MLEIERKFLVSGDEFLAQCTDKSHIAQGYIPTAPGRTVRIRVRGEKGYVTIKGNSTDDGLSRYEWEKEIPVGEAMELMGLCGPGIIDKTRHLVPAGSHVFEVDVFHGENEGLVMAEVELSAPDEPFERPAWLGEEVTGDVRYYNKYLSKHPYSGWDAEKK